MYNFGEQLKNLRLNLNMSQEDFGTVFGMNKSRISQYELNKRQPDFGTLVRFANYLHVSTDHLLGLSSMDIPIYTDAEKNIIDKYRQLNAEGIDYINHQMEIALQL